MFLNKNWSLQNLKLPLLPVVFTFSVKILFLLTHHIQEDAFITWRVAQNLMDYGVIGFNGDLKISASTTHLYVFVSYIFNLIFGKEHFIIPLLVFNSLLFTLGSWMLAIMLLKNRVNQAVFIVLFGLLPPSVKISILGMEYAMLFFLEMSLLYFGFFKYQKWALILFPVLILFTRIDTVIFLGIVFLTDIFFHKKLNGHYILGGILGVLLVFGFNWFYFGEWVNNTIIAKSLSYARDLSLFQQWHWFSVNYGNFWGMLKLPGDFNPFTILVLLFEIAVFIALVRQKNNRNFFIWIIFVFAWAKQLIFMSQRSYFDWYYWVPQVLLFSLILVFVLEQKKRRIMWISLLIIFYILPMLAFQIIHSIATGNGEWNYRRQIGIFLKHYEKDKNQYIVLEPAGYIPYFSGLKAIDVVGLVDKEIQQEIKADKKNVLRNTALKRKPKYLLTEYDLFTTDNASYFQQYYRLIRRFRVSDYLESENRILEKIYRLKPSGSDYNLYERK